MNMFIIENVIKTLRYIMISRNIGATSKGPKWGNARDMLVYVCRICRHSLRSPVNSMSPCRFIRSNSVDLGSNFYDRDCNMNCCDMNDFIKLHNSPKWRIFCIDIKSLMVSHDCSQICFVLLFMPDLFRSIKKQNTMKLSVASSRHSWTLDALSLHPPIYFENIPVQTGTQ